jgi:hypothetical protein
MIREDAPATVPTGKLAVIFKQPAFRYNCFGKKELEVKDSNKHLSRSIYFIF